MSAKQKTAALCGQGEQREPSVRCSGVFGDTAPRSQAA